jgi:hypothetical protein
MTHLEIVENDGSSILKEDFGEISFGNSEAQSQFEHFGYYLSANNDPTQT